MNIYKYFSHNKRAVENGYLVMLGFFIFSINMNLVKYFMKNNANFKMDFQSLFEILLCNTKIYDQFFTLTHVLPMLHFCTP